jgi:hypothetical protein
MSVSISFYGLSGGAAVSLSTSGLGFYGSGGFGASVAVASYQDSTFITDSAGAVSGAEVTNIKYISSGSGQVGGTGGETVALSGIPIESATLNIHLQSTAAAVQVRNVVLYIYDRIDTDNPASGVTSHGFEILPGGSGDTVWTTGLAGSGQTLPLTDSPGESGVNAGGAIAASGHDWYVGLSASPDSIGSKTSYGLFISMEYL